MHKRFLVVCQARTGSTMLTSALQQHPDLCMHGEVLNLRSDDQLEYYGLDYNNPGSIIDYFRQTLRRAPDEYIDRYVLYPGRFKLVGFKFKYEELSDKLLEPARNYVIRNNDIIIIHMTRKNIWKRFISEYIAVNITNSFNYYEGQKELSSLKDISLNLDFDTVKSALDKSIYWQNEYRNLFSNHKIIEITYEEFESDQNLSFKKITDFLGVKFCEFRPFTKKINKYQIEKEIVKNYEELKLSFHGSPYEKYFS